MTEISIRVPLAALPLSLFTTYCMPSSPISLPSKRPATALSPSGGSRAEGSRKVSRTERNSTATAATAAASGSGTRSGSGRRGDPEITPKIKDRLERDELGVGKSPARRLFVNVNEGEVRPGVSGTSPAPSPTKQPYFTQSPPLTISPLPSPIPDENGVIRSIHDPGFPIHADNHASGSGSIGVGIGTPDSRRTNSLSLPSADTYPPSPTTSRLDDQENIPPRSAVTTPMSTRGSPKKWIDASGGSSRSTRSTRSTRSSPGTSEEHNEEMAAVLTESSLNTLAGSGLGLGKKRRGPSKLVQVTLRVPSDATVVGLDISDDEEEGGEGAELTPGRRGVEVGGKRRMVIEADDA